MKTDNFSKRFFSICGGISLILISAAAFTYSIKSSEAAPAKSIVQTGTAENYIPLGINNGYAYWVIYNTSDGYKFRRASLTNGKWEDK